MTDSDFALLMLGYQWEIVGCIGIFIFGYFTGALLKGDEFQDGLNLHAFSAIVAGIMLGILSFGLYVGGL